MQRRETRAYVTTDTCEAVGAVAKGCDTWLTSVRLCYGVEPGIRCLSAGVNLRRQVRWHVSKDVHPLGVFQRKNHAPPHRIVHRSRADGRQSPFRTFQGIGQWKQAVDRLGRQHQRHAVAEATMPATCVTCRVDGG